MKTITVLLLAAVILMAGCSKKDPLAPVETAPPVIMPLAIGNTWTYDWYKYQPGSSIPYDTTIDMVSIIDTLTYDNELWYRARGILDVGGISDTNFCYYTNRENGLYYSSVIGGTVNIEVKYPADSGNLYEGMVDIMTFPMGLVPIRVESNSAPVAVPAGSYNCYQYRLVPDEANARYDDYFCPNVGLVMRDWRYYDPTYGWSRYWLFELRSVVLN